MAFKWFCAIKRDYKGPFMHGAECLPFPLVESTQHLGAMRDSEGTLCNEQLRNQKMDDKKFKCLKTSGKSNNISEAIHSPLMLNI